MTIQHCEHYSLCGATWRRDRYYECPDCGDDPFIAEELTID